MEINMNLTTANNNVLLVDDDKSLREVISIILTDEGYNVIQAENGANALEVLNGLGPKEYPSCMVLDLMMPIMDGNELLEVMGRDYANGFGKIPVIVCSAEGRLKTHEQVVAKLEKPINIELLCSAIRGCAEH